MLKEESIFLEWSKKKFEIEYKNIKHIVKKRQFWLYYIWINLWNEEIKKRLIRKLDSNWNDFLFDNNDFLEILDKVKSLI